MQNLQIYFVFSA